MKVDTLNPLDCKSKSPRKAVNIIKLKSKESFFASSKNI